MFRPKLKPCVISAPRVRPSPLGGRVIRAIRSELLLWRDGGYDFFEARVAAQRVPERQ